MIKTNLRIEGIPAILWGKPSDKLFIAVHGNMSSKKDDAICQSDRHSIGIITAM